MTATATGPSDLLVGGAWTASRSGRRFDVLNPATGEVVGTVADAGPEDALDALGAAASAAGSWARSAPRVRGEILRRGFELVVERADELAQLMTLEMGKPLKEARGEVAYGAEFLRWFAEVAVRPHGTFRIAPDGGSRLLTQVRAVGPCLLITPWNFPLAMATRKVAPAIAAGCTMVLKPAELTPLTALLFADIMREAGLPDGVLNVVTTSTSPVTMGAVMQDPRLRKLSFTGSTPVGRILLRSAASRVLRTSMELGGDAPFVVFEDADIDAAVSGAMIAKFRNMGQACTAANRFLVHESVAAAFAAELAHRTDELSVGDGLDPATDIGPLIDDRARDRVEGLVETALASGARRVTARTDRPTAGSFVRPSVLTEVAPEAEILAEEIFGPVAPIVTFANEAEAIAMANATDMGLASYVYSRDHARILRFSEAIEAGMLGVNTGIVSNPAAPFGGVKQSGLGREGGDEGIGEYLETHYVAYPDPWQEIG